MPTYTAFTTTSGRDSADALGAAMERLSPEPIGIGVFDIEDGSGLWEVGGYFVEQPNETELALLASAFQARPFVVSELPEVDWVAHVKRELSPVIAGRFFVHGSHDADKRPQGSIPLLIEAAMAFGTGHHGTTQGCLNALERLIVKGFVARSVADIGCGTAVLAMAAAKVFPHDVWASDIDQVAVDVAVANIQANGLVGRVDCIVAAGFEHSDLQRAAPFDLIFANILKGPLISLAPDMKRMSRSGTYLILSGILNDQAEAVITVYRDFGYSLVSRDEIVDWTTLTLCQNSV